MKQVNFLLMFIFMAVNVMAQETANTDMQAQQESFSSQVDMSEDEPVEEQSVEETSEEEVVVESEPVVSEQEKQIQELTEKLKSQSWKDRKAAVDTIGSLTIANKLELLRSVLTSDKKYVVRMSALKVVIALEAEDIIPALSESMKDENELIRSTALEALINFGEEAVDPIGEALNDQSEDIRTMALKSLMLMEESIALKYLDIALSDQSSAIRELAIAELFSKYEKNVSAAGVIVESFAKSINDKERDLRRKTIDCVAAIGGVDSIEVLASALAHADAETRMSAAKALGNMGGEQVVTALSKSITDSELDIRLNAIKFLSTINTPSALKAYAAGVSDRDYRVRKKVMGLLALNGDETIVDQLRKALSDRKLDIKISAVYILGEIGNDESVDTIAMALSDSDKEVQAAALRMLRVLKSERCLTKVGRFILSDKNFRIEAAEIFGEIADRKALKYLLQVLPEEKDKTKKAIESAIEKIVANK